VIEFVAAVLVGLAFVGAATFVVRPDRPLDRTLHPYTQFARARLGADHDIAPALGGGRPANLRGAVAGPLVGGARSLVEAGVDVAADDQLTLRLRRAGYVDARPETYRRAQLRAGAAGALGGLLGLGGLAQLSGGTWWTAAAVGAVAGLPAGAVLYRSTLERRAATRARRLRLEVYSVTLALSVMCRAGRGPIGSVRDVVARGSGTLCDDLRHGMHWMDRGAGSVEVLDRLARETPEPAVARLLRLLGSATVTGTNPSDALRDLAEQLRRQRIEQLDQWATKRRAAMLIPTMLFMFPVIVLFALAPGPSVLFGI
jgi:hypothetical protein